MATESLFQPCVTVADDGTISIDWGDSYVNSVLLDNDNEIVYDEPEGAGHAALLDSIVVGVSPAEGLRRLAAHIEPEAQ